MSRVELLSQASKIKETLSSNNSSLETFQLGLSSLEETRQSIQEPIQHREANTYRTFNGCDIVATFNGQVIGRLDSINYTMRRGE